MWCSPVSCGQQKTTAGTLVKINFNNPACRVTKCSILPMCSYEGGEKARGFKEGWRNRWGEPQIRFSTLSHLQYVAVSPITQHTAFSYFSHPLSPEVLRMFRSLKMLIRSTCVMLHVPKRMNWDPEYRKDRMWQNRIKISLIKISPLLHQGCSKASDLLLPALWVYFSQLCHYPQRLKQREFMQKQKKTW